MEAKHKKVEQENEWLKQEMEELWAGFVTQKGELKGEYQNYPSDDENEAISSHVHGNGDAAKVGPSGGQA
ncbi:hypothetical protein AAG906_030907 [Vitis piasezkii]